MIAENRKDRDVRSIYVLDSDTFPARPITHLAMSSDDNSIVHRDKPRERQYAEVHVINTIGKLNIYRSCVYVCVRVPARVFRVNCYALFSGCIARYHRESRGKHRKYTHQDTRTQILAFAYPPQHVYPTSRWTT